MIECTKPVRPTPGYQWIIATPIRPQGSIARPRVPSHDRPRRITSHSLAPAASCSIATPAGKTHNKQGERDFQAFPSSSASATSARETVEAPIRGIGTYTRALTRRGYHRVRHWRVIHLILLMRMVLCDAPSRWSRWVAGGMSCRITWSTILGVIIGEGVGVCPTKHWTGAHEWKHSVSCALLRRQVVFCSSL